MNNKQKILKTKIVILIFFLGIYATAIGQKGSIALAFTLTERIPNVKLDSIKIMNLTQGGNTMLFWPDTVIILDYVDGIKDNIYKKSALKIFQNYPNPVKEKTYFDLYIPKKGKVHLGVYDASGRQVLTTDRMLERGCHSFLFIPGSGNMFIITSYWNKSFSSIKVLTSGHLSSVKSLLKYEGVKNNVAKIKNVEKIHHLSFNLGDTLLCIGFAKTANEVIGSDIIEDVPQTDKIYKFKISQGIPCQSTPIIHFQGRTYKTIQIFDQCWMKENLNVGTMIDFRHDMQNNGIIEKYCYNNKEDSCTVYGGLYQWNEIVNYSVKENVQGICPSGWHIPSNTEWRVLESSVDSKHDFDDPEWDKVGSRGFDAGFHLKSVSGWMQEGSGNDTYGFSGLPAGARSDGNIFFYGWGNSEFWWTSSDYLNYAFYRGINSTSSKVERGLANTAHGMSVRCVKD